jgi:hypothetical protein
MHTQGPRVDYGRIHANSYPKFWNMTILVMPLISPPNAYPLRAWAVSRISRPTSPVRIRTVVSAFPATKVIHISSADIPSIRETLRRYIKWQIWSRLFGWVVDPLELLIEKITVGSSEEIRVTAEVL